jgi:hypothetical protein
MSDNIQEFLQWAEDQGLIPHVETARHGQDFRIVSDRMAVWACQVIEQAKAEVRHRIHERAQQVDDLNAWVDEAQRAVIDKQAWLWGHLETYLREAQASGRLGDTKSLSLPGKRRLQFRKQAVDYEVTDDAKFLAWCRIHGLIEESWQWGEAKKRLLPADNQIGAGVLEQVIDERTGEVGYAAVPGVVVSRRSGEGFSVTLATDASADEQKEGTL